MDNTTVVPGWHSLPALTQTIRSGLLCGAHLVSISTTQVLGVMNVGADLLSRGNPHLRDWRLLPQVEKQIWEIYCLRIARKRASVVFSTSRRCTTVGGCAGTPLAEDVALRCSSSQPQTSHSGQSEGEGLSLILVAPPWQSKLWI